MYNIMDYGAMGDGAANDAPAIQKAVDECSQAGGGVVLFPGGSESFCRGLWMGHER